MSIDFPNAPIDNQEFTSGDRTYIYNATKGYWTVSAPTTLGFTGSQGDVGFTGSTGEGYAGVTASAAEINTLDGFTGTTDNLNATQYLSNRNKIINGNFDIWQRGTSIGAGTGERYLADRWINHNGGSGLTATREAFTPGQTDVPGEPTYFHRAVVSSVTGEANFAILKQKLEGVRTLADRTVTVSFWAKADANKSMTPEFSQNFGTGGAPSTTVTGIRGGSVNLTTSWQKFTVTVAVPSIAGKTLGSGGNDTITLHFWFDAGSNFNFRANTLGHQSGTFDIAQVQIEIGTVATPFEDRHIKTELALCQRYYQQGNFNGTGAVGAKTAPATAGLMFNSVTRFPVVMRAVPTIVLPTITYINSSDISTVAREDCFITRVTATAAGIYRAYSGGLDVYTADAEI